MTTEQWERENQDILKTMYETGGYGVRRRRARGELTCACCGKTFDPVRADARFCSNACRQKSYRQRAAEAAAQ